MEWQETQKEGQMFFNQQKKLWNVNFDEFWRETDRKLGFWSFLWSVLSVEVVRDNVEWQETKNGGETFLINRKDYWTWILMNFEDKLIENCVFGVFMRCFFALKSRDIMWKRSNESFNERNLLRNVNFDCNWINFTKNNRRLEFPEFWWSVLCVESREEVRYKMRWKWSKR